MKQPDPEVNRFSRPALQWAATVAFAGTLLYLGLGLYLHPVRAQTNVPAAAAPQALHDALQAASDLKATLETTAERAENIQKLLAALVTVSSIFGFAVGVFTYVNLSQIKASAEKELTQLRADFPAIARMNEGVERVFTNVRSEGALMFDGWDADSYERLSESSRESIRMSELTFSALEFFDFLKSPKLSGYATEIYIAFGRFYGSSYRTSHVNNEASVERAKIYLRKALKSPDDFLKERALADLGTICSWQAAFTAPGVVMREALQEARKSFDEACALRPYNPSALIGRAWVRRRAGEPLEKSIGDLDDLLAAVADRKLSGEEKRRYLRTAWFNRACYRVVWAASQHSDKSGFDSALLDLRASRSAAIETGKFEVWLKNLNQELEPGKDLSALLPAHKEELERLKDRDTAKT